MTEKYLGSNVNVAMSKVKQTFCVTASKALHQLWSFPTQVWTIPTWWWLSVV